MHTHIGVVLDMSGSMNGFTEDTKGSVSSYVKEIKKEIKGGVFSLTAFDTVFENWIDSKPLSRVNIDEVLKKYRPRGWTALYDAIGNTISKMRKQMNEFDEAILVVITDGYENSSKKYTSDKIKKLVTKLQKKGNWTFVYLGADVDAWDESSKIGISWGNTAQYKKGARQKDTGIALAAATITRSYSPGKTTANFFSDSGLPQNYEEEFNADQVLADVKEKVNESVNSSK
jgi:hypothetical protein